MQLLNSRAVCSRSHLQQQLLCSLCTVHWVNGCCHSYELMGIGRSVAQPLQDFGCSYCFRDRDRLKPDRHICRISHFTGSLQQVSHATLLIDRCALLLWDQCKDCDSLYITTDGIWTLAHSSAELNCHADLYCFRRKIGIQ